MKLADRSPATVLILAHVVVFGVVLVEIAMWSAANAVFMGATLVLAAAVAIGVLRWFFHLLDEEEPGVVAKPAAAPVAEPTAVEAPRSKAPAAPAPRHAALTH